MSENNLPVGAFRSEILSALAANSVVIITAETGAGKSTQVPRYLIDAGYRVVVTQPRRLAARSVAARVAEELGEELGQTVGIRTSQDRTDSEATRALFCTDGLALVRELMGRGGNRDVLVLDEVHEWNMNLEVLAAWAKREIARNPGGFRLVIMSATMEAEKLSVYFGGAPVISVPGRLFPVETKRAGSSLVADTVSLLREGRNVLVFQPGKAEIDATIAAVKASGVAAEVLPLHGQLEPAEQAKCFRAYGRPKCVVATNVAQTSVTIPDIDAVVDSGMERRVEVVDGVEGLYLKPVSAADSKQRAGRAGRTKAGVYIDHCPDSHRPDFPVAEILRSRLDQTVLRLAEAGFDMEAMEFFHQPPVSEIRRAKDTLRALGCLTDDNSVTAVGKKVGRLPVSVQFARMIVEADHRGVVDDVITAAAVLEAGGIIDRKAPAWKTLTEGEKDSDVLAQLAVWRNAKNLRSDSLRESGVHAGAFRRAQEVRRHLADALRGSVRFGSTEKREDILLSLCAGMVDHLYRRDYGRYVNGDSVERELAKESVVSDSASWVVGLPWDLEVPTRRGGKTTLRLIQMATKVDPLWLAEVAPHLVKREQGLTPKFDLAKDSVVSTTRTEFRGRVVSEETVPDLDHPQAAAVFGRFLAAQAV